MAESERQNSKSPPWHQGQDQESVSFGTWLRRQREARNIELREIADHTKISIRYLEALETDRFEILPAPVFTKGFLSQYGRYIGLDPDQVVNTYLNALQEGDSNEREEPRRRRDRDRQRLFAPLLVVGGVVLLALVAYLTFRAERSTGDEIEEPPAMAVPAVQPPVPAELPTVLDESAMLAPLVVTLDFVDDGWLEAEVDGRRQLSEQIAKGESRRLLAEERVGLGLGNPEGVRVEVNGTPYELPPAVEESGLHRVEITLETADELARQGVP